MGGPRGDVIALSSAPHAGRASEGLRELPSVQRSMVVLVLMVGRLLWSSAKPFRGRCVVADKGSWC